MDWRESAACRDADPELFFPTGTTGTVWQETQRAKAVCRTCPVATPCLEWALSTGQKDGVWGGLSEAERGVRRRRRRSA